MSIILYILFFIAGIACGFYIYKNKFKNSVELKQSMPVLINEEKKTEEINQEQNVELLDPAETLKKSLDNLYIVNELGRKVTSSLNLRQTFNHLYTTINSMMDAAVLELSVCDEITGTNKIFSNSESNEIDNTNHMSDWCFKNNREVFLTDAENDYARYVFQPLVLPDGRIAKSVIIFPIINHNAVSGTLCIISFQKNSFNDYHREIIRLLLGYIAIAIDNAIRHEELNLTKIRAEQSEKFKEQFLANMSHEIRTPINAVTGMTRLLLDKQPRQDQLLYLESIRNASDSLLVIINDILDLSKIEAGKIELEKIDLSIFDIVKNVKEIMRFKAEEKGLVLKDQIDINIPSVLIGDPTRLTQILINLIGNAVKFTEKGSVLISVTKNGESSSQSEVNNDENIASLVFEVTDTGIGMTEDQQSKLFQDYTQAGPETSRKYGGTGLGLSISKKLVDIQGGQLTVKSGLGKGSTFTFTMSFPVSKNKTIAVSEKNISKEMLHELNGIKILLADDNEYNRIVVKETLQLKIRNITVDEAVDGEKAIELVKRNDYDLILMDLVMPQMDGFEATAYIRSKLLPSKNQVKIIALTASVVKSEMDKCFAAGMNGFIPKPFKNHELIGAIYKALNSDKEVVFEEITVKEKLSNHSGKYIDLNYLYEFTDGDEIRMQRHIDLFIAKTPFNIDNLKSALQKNDLETIRVTAHSMKPLLRSTGVLEGVELAEMIELNCFENKNIDQLPELIEKLSSISEKAIQEIKTIGFSN